MKQKLREEPGIKKSSFKILKITSSNVNKEKNLEQGLTQRC